MLPFRLRFEGSPKTLKQARVDAGNRATADRLNDRMDSIEGLLNQAANRDGASRDLNDSYGEVILLGESYEDKSYDVYVKFNSFRPEGSAISAAEIECDGKALFKLKSEADVYSSQLFDQAGGQDYLIAGKLDGQAEVILSL